MSETKRNGKIITFYSYKGGTGRSMALANVAWILASQGKHVLTLDWDLEAPGLHRYFYPFLLDKTLTASEGIIDFVHKFTSAAAISSSRKEQEEAASETIETLSTDVESGDFKNKTDDEWYKPYSNILRYATSLKWDFKDKGSLDFIPAGRQGPSYPTRINSFNWDHFYNKLGGGLLLELAKERMRAEYDYILIDSRTGVSDTAGICTIQMPDILVICFTLNNQSIEGASDVANDVFEKRLNAAKARAKSSPHEQPKSEEAIQIFPVPMRAENAEKVKLQTRKNYAREKFRLFPNSLSVKERERYWGYVPVTYIPFYAYEEILAVFGDDPADRVSILAAAEELCSYITGGEIQKLAPASELERKKVLEEFEGGLAKGSPADEENRFAESYFERLGQEEQESVRQLMVRLVRAAQPEEVGGDALLRVNVNDLEERALKVLRPLVNATILQKELDSATGKEVVKIASDTLIKNWPRLQGWIDKDREFLLWRQKLQLKIDDWQKGQRETEALLSGTPLEEARAWLESRRKDLNDAEASYIELSIAESKRRLREQEMAQARLEEDRRLREQEMAQQQLSLERLLKEQEAARERSEALERRYQIEKRRKVPFIALSILTVLAFAAFVFFRFGFNPPNEKETKSLRLAAFSSVAEDPELKVLLAIEAARAEQTTQAVNALRASLMDFRQAAILSGHSGTVFSATFSSDGKLILTASADQTALIWSQEGDAWRILNTFNPLIGYVQSAAFSPDNKFVGIGGYDRDVKIYDVATEEEVARFVETGSVLDVNFSHDGKYFITASSSNTATIWDWKGVGKKSLASLIGHLGNVNSAVYSPDDKLILTAGSDRTARLWDAASSKLIGVLTGHTGKLYNADFSPDGRLIVTASEDSTTRIWDTATMKQIGAPLTGHTGDVWDAAFSPDGSLIVTAGADRTARVWDVKTRETKLVLRGHSAAIYSAAFSPDGKSVMTASDDKTARLWDVSGNYSVGGSVEELISQGCKKLSRNMTQEEWPRYITSESYRKTCENLP